MKIKSTGAIAIAVLALATLGSGCKGSGVDDGAAPAGTTSDQEGSANHREGDAQGSPDAGSGTQQAQASSDGDAFGNPDSSAGGSDDGDADSSPSPSASPADSNDSSGATPPPTTAPQSPKITVHAKLETGEGTNGEIAEVTLDWSATSASDCTKGSSPAGIWSGDAAAQGSGETVLIDKQTTAVTVTFAVHCTSSNGSSIQSTAQVTIPALPTASPSPSAMGFAITGPSVWTYGEPAELTWSAGTDNIPANASVTLYFATQSTFRATGNYYHGESYFYFLTNYVQAGVKTYNSWGVFGLGPIRFSAGGTEVLARGDSSVPALFQLPGQELRLTARAVFTRAGKVYRKYARMKMSFADTIKLPPDHGSGVEMALSNDAPVKHNLRIYPFGPFDAFATKIHWTSSGSYCVGKHYSVVYGGLRPGLSVYGLLSRANGVPKSQRLPANGEMTVYSFQQDDDYNQFYVIGCEDSAGNYSMRAIEYKIPGRIP